MVRPNLPPATADSPARRSAWLRLLLVTGAMTVAAIASVAYGSSVASGAEAAAPNRAGRAAVHGTGAGRTARRVADTVDHHAVNAVVYNGWKMFEVYCTRCHGEDAVGSSFAPALIASVGPNGAINHRAFFTTVTAGRPSKGMPTWGNLLSPEQKEDVWNYLRARAVGGLAPGRPHVAKGANRDSTVLPKALGQDTTWQGPPQT